jgi:GNAT superfamily N-acetyltransferase
LSFTIRPLILEDYDQAVLIHNAQNEPHFHITTEHMTRANYANSRFDPLYRWYVATTGATVVALGYLRAQWGAQLVPGHYWANVFTNEAYRHTQADSQLLAHAIHEVDEPVTTLWSCVRADFHDASGFLADFNFQEAFRTYGSELLPVDADKDKLMAFVTHVEQQGFSIVPYAELDAVTEVNPDPLLLRLHYEAAEDTPYHEPVVSKHQLDFRDPEIDPQSIVVAVNLQGEIIGQSYLYHPHQGSQGLKVQVGFTSVARAFRNKGLGTALKASLILYGLNRDYEQFGGGGARENESMLRVNRKLGLDIEPDWVTFRAAT